jgi:hypothetical protein
LPIYESPGPLPTKMVSGDEGSHSSQAGSLEPDQSVVGIVMAVGGGAGLDAAAAPPRSIQRHRLRSLIQTLRGGPIGTHKWFLNLCMKCMK